MPITRIVALKLTLDEWRALKRYAWRLQRPMGSLIRDWIAGHLASLPREEFDPHANPPPLLTGKTKKRWPGPV